MITRTLTESIRNLSKFFPVIYLGGPRQSGKTTLLKYLYPNLPYSNLENPDVRQLAETDPRRYLGSFPAGAILDEAQRVPHLFSYLQGIVDDDRTRQFILSGSQNFLLMEQITQSLAGRVGILKLLPLSWEELPTALTNSMSPEQWAWQGGYPMLYDRSISPALLFPNYIDTYLQRDVRLLHQVGDLNRFNRFLRICAGRSGQLLNMSQLARDADVAVNTAKTWLSVMEASYLIFFLQPYHRNFNKRYIKSPKLYFHDTGLLCYLLGIQDTTQLDSHYHYGHIMENMIIAELYKLRTHRGKRPQFWFWRDSNGNEVDLIIEEDGKTKIIEVKSSKTMNTRHFKGLAWWQKLTDTSPEDCGVIYLGEEGINTQYGRLIPWREWA
jgi:predicted AAA+ superfamily ATPase